MSAIQLFDLNGEQRFTGTSLGGGGAQPLSVLGPFTVTYAELDPVPWFQVAALAAGTIILRTFVVITTAFTAGGEKVSLGVSDAGQVHTTTIDERDAAPAGEFAWGEWEATFSAGVLPHGAIAGPSGAFLAAQDAIGGNSAGEADIYVLVKLP